MKKTKRRKRIFPCSKPGTSFHLSLLLIVCLFLWGGNASAQVNIETLRKADPTEGLHINIATKFGILAGNSENQTINGNVRTDYLFDRYHLLSIANWARGKSDDKLFQNKAFLHLRGVKTLTKTYAVEAFAQEEFNDFISIKERNLFGGGVRLTPFSPSPQEENDSDYAFHVGVGLMRENERFDEDTQEKDTRILRSTNYLSLKWEIKEWLLFSTTCYYQVDTTRSADFRILANGSLGFNLTEKLLFTINYTYRYDNEPPQGLKNFDLALTNGISYLF